MNAKVYVDNMAAATTENDLTDLFSAYGNVVEVNVPVNRTNGRPRGFGFVTMATPAGHGPPFGLFMGRRSDRKLSR